MSGKKALNQSPEKGKKSVAKHRRGQFPASAFEDSLSIAETIQRQGAGNPMRRLTIFDHLQKSPDSGHSRQLVTNSSKYGLTKGGYQAETIELTESGRKATSEDITKREKIKARYELAIGNIEIFSKLYEQYKNNRLPSAAVLRDFVTENGISEAQAAKCVDTFIVNAKFVGLLKTIAGAERIITIEHLLDEIPLSDGATTKPVATPTTSVEEDNSFENICFYLAPIGDEESEFRQHSDLFMGSLIEPALQEFNLKLVRADSIGEPGMITAQIIEHIAKSRLVIADLSFHNPNVFYELALRHATKRPIVQLIRTADKVPFDVSQFRTVIIDTTDIYSLVPKLETYKAEIATQIRSALEGVDQASNPLSLYYPDFWNVIANGE